MPTCEGWEASGDAWLEACDRIAGCEHWRKGERISVLFDAERAHMRPLPGVVFDACDWRSARCDKTGVVTVNAHRYLAGARYGRTRVRVGVRALRGGETAARADLGDVAQQVRPGGRVHPVQQVAYRCG